MLRDAALKSQPGTVSHVSRGWRAHAGAGHCQGRSRPARPADRRASRTASRRRCARSANNCCARRISPRRAPTPRSSITWREQIVEAQGKSPSIAPAAPASGRRGRWRGRTFAGFSPRQSTHAAHHRACVERTREMPRMRRQDRRGRAALRRAPAESVRRRGRRDDALVPRAVRGLPAPGGVSRARRSPPRSPAIDGSRAARPRGQARCRASPRAARGRRRPRADRPRDLPRVQVAHREGRVADRARVLRRGPVLARRIRACHLRGDLLRNGGHPRARQTLLAGTSARKIWSNWEV